MFRDTWVQSQVASYQRLWKWYLKPSCLTLSNIRCVSRVKWSNPGKGVAPFPIPWWSSYRKGSHRVTLDYSRQLYFTFYCPSWRWVSMRVTGVLWGWALSFMKMTDDASEWSWLSGITAHSRICSWHLKLLELLCRKGRVLLDLSLYVNIVNM